MAGFFRRLLGSGDRTAPVPAAAELPEMPANDWFVEDNGLPYPRWKVIREWMTANVEKQDRHEAYNMAVRHWMQRFCEAAGEAWKAVESPHFILLSSAEQTGRRWILKMAEDFRRAIFEALGEFAWSTGCGKHLVMVMDEDLYARYVSHYSSGGYMAASSGVTLSGRGYVHIAINERCGQFDDGNFKRTLAHEFSHNALCKRPLPRWLDEAVAMYFEDRLGGGEESMAWRLEAHFETINARELVREFKAWWTEERMQGFWRGELWSSAGDKQGFCYEMSRIIFRLVRQTLNNESGRFRNFIGAARQEDAGEAAARQWIGQSLGTLAAEFLGEGNWTPNPPGPIAA